MRLAQSDLKSLQVFRAVVEYGSFVGAQTALGLGQPAVSFHVKSLEERLGFRLCQRGRSGFSLTEKGALVYEHSKGLFSSLSEFESLLGELRHTLTGTLRLGVVDNTISNPDLSVHDIVHAFLKQAPSVDMEIVVSLPEELLAHIGNGGLDIAIIPELQQVKGLNFTKFYEEAHSLYAARNHPLARLEEANVADVEKHPLVVRSYGKLRELAHFPAALVRAQASTMEALAIFVLSGHFIGYLPDHYATAWVREGRLRAILPDTAKIVSSFFIVTRVQQRQSLILRAFIRQLVSASWTRAHARD